jgi:hypothetical protein
MQPVFSKTPKRYFEASKKKMKHGHTNGNSIWHLAHGSICSLNKSEVEGNGRIHCVDNGTTSSQQQSEEVKGTTTTLVQF